MPYDERALTKLYASADITPMGIQLEVNADIFSIIRNLLISTQAPCPELERDCERLGMLLRDTDRELARVESRKSWGIPMKQQIAMLLEAFAIEEKYLPDRIFLSASDIPQISSDVMKRERSFDKDAARTFFADRVWPVIAAGRTGGLDAPGAYLVAGQPGAGIRRITSLLIEKHDDDIIRTAKEKLLGLHPRCGEWMRKYGNRCISLTEPLSAFMSGLAAEHAIAGRYPLIIEDFLEDPESTARMTTLLKKENYKVTVIFRACSRKKSWKAVHQLYLQQRLKAPGLARILTKDDHDTACRVFLSSANDLIRQNTADRLIIKGLKGLLYDSDDMPTENAADILTRRMHQHGR